MSSILRHKQTGKEQSVSMTVCQLISCIWALKYFLCSLHCSVCDHSRHSPQKSIRRLQQHNWEPVRSTIKQDTKNISRWNF
ncbi:hypothetical protein Mapa_003933 [Marchantia paleacea]|nr:hypothetical protein Mapa_003933 [Marchantia paleacea]